MATVSRLIGQHAHATVRSLSARLLLFLALAGISIQSVSAAKPLSDCAQRLGPLVKTKMLELGVPGLIVSVEAPKICHWTETLGIRDVTKQAPIRLKEHMSASVPGLIRVATNACPSFMYAGTGLRYSLAASPLNDRSRSSSPGA